MPLAVAVALNPTGIVVVVLILVGAQGRRNGVVFAAGWFLSILAVGLVTLVIADALGPTDADGDPATWTSLLFLGLGVALLVLAARGWQGRPRPDDPPQPTPGWMRSLDGASPIRTLGISVLLGGANPKNVALVIAAGEAIALAGVVASDGAIAMLVFAALASLGVAVPVAMAVVRRDRSREPLERLKGVMIANGPVILAVIMLIFGVILIGDAVAGLTA